VKATRAEWYTSCATAAAKPMYAAARGHDRSTVVVADVHALLVLASDQMHWKSGTGTGTVGGAQRCRCRTGGCVAESSAVRFHRRL